MTVGHVMVRCMVCHLCAGEGKLTSDQLARVGGANIDGYHRGGGRLATQCSVHSSNQRGHNHWRVLGPRPQRCVVHAKWGSREPWRQR